MPGEAPQYPRLRQCHEAGRVREAKGICKLCAKQFEVSEMEADHITPWTKGGKTHEEKCQLLCKPCNRRKSNK